MTTVAKVCVACGEGKLLTEFHRKPTGKHGRSSRCADCTNEARRGYRDSARTSVTTRLHPKLRDLVSIEADRRGVPNQWLVDHLLAHALRELSRGTLVLPASAPRRRHRDVPKRG